MCNQEETTDDEEEEEEQTVRQEKYKGRDFEDDINGEERERGERRERDGDLVI